jgi:hypothetical protein
MTTGSASVRFDSANPTVANPSEGTTNGVVMRNLVRFPGESERYQLLRSMAEAVGL